MVLYVATTADEYEFPIYVADTIEQLARVLGKRADNVRSQLSHQAKRLEEGKKRVNSKNCTRYYRVEVEE